MEINIGLANLLNIYGLLEIFRYVQLELLFGIGPSIYLFTKTITDSSYRLSRKDYVHFLPVVFEFIFYRTPIYRLGANGLYQDPPHPFTTVYITEQWLGTASILIYIILSVHLLSKYRKWIKTRYSNIDNKALGWLRTPVYIFSFFWFFWIALIKIDYFIFDNVYREFYFFPINIGLAIVTTWIGITGYIKTHNNAPGFLDKPEKTVYTPCDPAETEKIVSLMNTTKPYLSPDFDLQKLSELAGLNTKTISRIINQNLKMNFYEFVNKYRVDEFKRRLQNDNHEKFTLLGHAFECGFNSKSTFNHIFKKYTEYTPREYYKMIKK